MKKIVLCVSVGICLCLMIGSQIYFEKVVNNGIGTEDGTMPTELVRKKPSMPSPLPKKSLPDKPGPQIDSVKIF